MSINLRCEQMELWQTPTWVTSMCLHTPNGDYDHWENVKFRYKAWVRSRLNGSWSDRKEHEIECQLVREHLDKLDSFDKLDFYCV